MGGLASCSVMPVGTQALSSVSVCSAILHTGEFVLVVPCQPVTLSRKEEGKEMALILRAWLDQPPVPSRYKGCI